MKYWHLATDEEIEALYKREPPMTYGDLDKEYLQPGWCTYTNALHGPMGCWSLTDKDLRKQISLDYCKDCECCVRTTTRPEPTPPARLPESES